MLHDMRGSYIRRERPDFLSCAVPALTTIAVFFASMIVSAALLYLLYAP